MSELPESQTFGDYAKWPGRDVVDPTGERLGEVREIYLDDATDRPEWVLVETGSGPRFVPLAGAVVDGVTIRVVHRNRAVTSAPDLPPSKELTQEQERRLYDHYDVQVSEDESNSLLPDPEQPPPEPAAPEPSAAEPAPAAPVPVEAPRTEPEMAPAPEPAAELPPEGETAEPEDTGPMVPPRPEPITPPPPPPPQPAASSGPSPAVVAGAALAALIALLVIIRSRRG